MHKVIGCFTPNLYKYELYQPDIKINKRKGIVTNHGKVVFELEDVDKNESNKIGF